MSTKKPGEAELGPRCPKRPRLDLTAGQPVTSTSHHAAKLVDEYDKITEEIFEEIINAIKDRKMAEAASKFMENLKHIVNSSLDIAVAGESGSGKSSFINAIRGLRDEDDGAAPTGIAKTTIQPTPYPHPKHSNVTIWDLPSIDTPDFQASNYLERVDFSRCDFLILITSEHFKSNHAQLAREVQKLGKRAYFVRSKVDADLEVAKKRQCRANKMVLGKIRDDCQQCLRNEGIYFPKVFLLSSRELHKYDFMALEETLERELPGHKRYAFILALPNISPEVSQKKKEAFLKQIWKWAFVSCGMAALTIRGLSVICDVTALMESLTKHWHNIGLDDESLNRLVEKINGSMEEIKAAINSSLANKITREQVQNLLTKVSGGVVTVIQDLVNSVPTLGSLVPGGISFGTTYNMLQDSLNEVATDAQRVLIVPLSLMFEKVLNLSCG